MLVLTRKKGERVMIGDDIVVTVIDVRGDGVRIGFDAPRGVSIQRAEVIAAVQAANTGAASASAQQADLLVGLLNKARKPEAQTAEAQTAEAAPEGAASAETEVSTSAGAVPVSAPSVPTASPKPAPRRRKA